MFGLWAAIVTVSREERFVTVFLLLSSALCFVVAPVQLLLWRSYCRLLLHWSSQ